ncbi:MAG: hypothetical protein WEA77_08210 [Hyphomonas sp.]|uniref:hypothetical protein n=1 Tax=Hyphomonas sp. TaxID=87 RepID=UPI0034A053CD
MAGLFASELAAGAEFAALVGAVRGAACNCGGAELRVSVSLGRVAAGGGETVSAVLPRAERALYNTKHNGKDHSTCAREVPAAS